eukprot:SAG31_NODE_4572_length_3127_cov_1.044914_4_plen_45_part_01
MFREIAVHRRSCTLLIFEREFYDIAAQARRARHSYSFYECASQRG